MIARVLFVGNLHTTTDTIYKLPISLFENVIVFIGGQTLSRTTGKKMSNVSQARKVRLA
jgi:hypothetical protein